MKKICRTVKAGTYLRVSVRHSRWQRSSCFRHVRKFFAFFKKKSDVLPQAVVEAKWGAAFRRRANSGNSQCSKTFDQSEDRMTSRAKTGQPISDEMNETGCETRFIFNMADEKQIRFSNFESFSRFLVIKTFIREKVWRKWESKYCKTTKLGKVSIKWT